MLQIHNFPVIAIGLFVAFLLARYLRLRSIPGPWITSFTDLYRVYHQRGLHFTSKLNQLHDYYGPLVRLGPNVVSVSDSSAISTIYTNHGEFKKADSVSALRGYINGEIRGSFIDLQDEEQITGIRRAISGAFAVKNLLDYEGDVDDSIEELLARIEKTPVVEGLNLFRQYQVDVLSKMAFSETPHALSTDADLAPYEMRDRLNHARLWQGAPNLEYLFFKTRIGNLLRSSPTPPKFLIDGAAKLKARTTQEPKSDGPGDLLDKYIAASKQYPDIMNPENLLRLTTSTISAGFDTTSLALFFIICYLVNYPQVYERLQSDIDDKCAAGQLSSPPRWTEVHKMEYLEAVVKEVLRHHSVASNPLERTVPAGGAMVSGSYLPAGTVVGCTPTTTNRDKAVFGEDADAFRPERWLTKDHARIVAMERGNLTFGAGKRVCIGKHIAELELMKTIPAIMMNYQIRSATPNKKIKLSESRLVGQEPVMLEFVARTSNKS